MASQWRRNCPESKSYHLISSFSLLPALEPVSDVPHEEKSLCYTQSEHLATSFRIFQTHDFEVFFKHYRAL